jgi:photosystem II stability/assembly factor-like uncharacterized protein
MPSTRAAVAAIIVLLAVSPRPAAREDAPAPAVNPSSFRGLTWRHVGPHRGGRVTAVAGHRRQPRTFYMGATGGGVWKTTDGGHYWGNVSDGFFETASIGAIDVAESNPDIVYVGTGSAAIRSNVITGRGMYKSTDAGRTWTHIGLRTAGQIGAVRVDRDNADVVFVAVLGQAFGPSADRGVFRTKDGGRTWAKVLFINDRTGVVSLAVNPSNPAEIYAGAWRALRTPWTIVSGGPASEGGLYKTTDGGDTWTHLTAGLPQTLVGKVDVDVARSNPSRVLAILEAPGKEGGVYRSEDAGATWKQVSSDARLLARPFYYTYIDVDPKSPDTVWVNNLALWRSRDGGSTWTAVPTPHGDNHGMWINPDDPRIMIQSNDGGANVSFDAGESWSTQYNQPTAELYQVEIDNQFPYRLYGAQQDNTTVIVPSLPPDMTTTLDRSASALWRIGPGCETGPIKPRPDRPSIVYGVCKGEFYRLNLDSGQEQSYWVYPQHRYGHAPKDIRYRFQRTSPFEISPHDPRVIYHTSHVVHRTKDEGRTWEVISPDLTANEPDKQTILAGEPITRDITGEEVYSTIYAIEESPVAPGVIWAGANDGPVHVTRDNGRTWQNVTPKGLPPGGRVQQIDPSPHRKGSAYIAYYRYLLDDWQPYVYRTDDYGATWTRLADGRNGIPIDAPARVVREDPDREGLLYAGTEFGMYVSFDNGGRWQPLQLNLPVTPVTDLRVHQRDLVVSTMGRGFWILDNLTPLHQGGGGVAGTNGSRGGGPAFDASAGAHLFAPDVAWRTRHSASGGRFDQPDYPAPGAQIDYHLGAPAAGPVALDILDRTGAVVRTYSSAPAEPPAAETAGMRPARGRGLPTSLGTSAGHHRFVWDLRYAGPRVTAGSGARSGPLGPPAPPGSYQVRLKVGEWSATRPLQVRLDPRVAADGVTEKDLDEQLALNRRIADAMAAAGDGAARVQQALKSRPDDAALVALRDALVTAPGSYPQPKLIDQLGNLYRMTTAADQKLGRDAFERFADLERELGIVLARVKTID